MLLLLFFVITISILDRQVLSVVAPILRDQFHLSNTQYGEILFCFLAGMTVGQIPVGIMMDRLGPRKSFVIIVCLWSLANMGHIFMNSVFQFCILRFLLGVGECGAYSGGTKVISQWFPPEDRAFAGGLFNSGSLAGAIIAPPLVVYLTLHAGWRQSFLIPSLAGMLWVIPWLRTYWVPSQHPKLAKEMHTSTPSPAPPITGGPGLLQLLALPAVWGVILMRAFASPVTNFYWYWLPEYLKRQRGMSFEMLGILSWLPFFAGGVGNIGGGWISRYLIKHGMTLDRARKLVIGVSIALSGCAVLVPLTSSTAVAVSLICIASLGINSFAANLIGVYTDLFPQTVLARVVSLTGIGDGVVSMTTMLLTGIVVDRFSYLPVFLAAGLLPLLSVAAFFLLVRRVRPVESLAERIA